MKGCILLEGLLEQTSLCMQHAATTYNHYSYIAEH